MQLQELEPQLAAFFGASVVCMCAGDQHRLGVGQDRARTEYIAMIWMLGRPGEAPYIHLIGAATCAVPQHNSPKKEIQDRPPRRDWNIRRMLHTPARSPCQMLWRLYRLDAPFLRQAQELLGAIPLCDRSSLPSNRAQDRNPFLLLCSLLLLPERDAKTATIGPREPAPIGYFESDALPTRPRPPWQKRGLCATPPRRGAIREWLSPPDCAA
ncbi:hypothetical protein C8Q78DRAFT_130975 [Trametes maxima]|nr:hypothetical protein C8Q78DRAFT_130975 [Trametes maxima]